MPALLFLKGYRRSFEGLLKYRKYGVSGYFSVTVNIVANNSLARCPKY